jgi:hypothetical protein
MPVDADLASFIAIDGAWTGILLGNGVSRAISDGFAYDSLFAVAQSLSVANPLLTHEIEIFNQLGTTNFELVLSALNQARQINRILKLEYDPIVKAYNRVRLGLIEAVHAIHIPWADISVSTLVAIRSALRQYQFVYSTNYDLLNYWSFMQNTVGFIDFFFGSTFDVSNTDVWDPTKTRILFVHGALHLYRSTGGTIKRTSGISGNLLQAFGEPLGEDQSPIPLFISEGTSKDKLRSIHSSDYLGFAYSELVRHEGSLVILGQSLDPAYDQHLIDAIKGRRRRRLGVGIYRGSKTETEIIAEKVAWLGKFQGLEFSIDFFDSSTHPLAAPTLSTLGTPLDRRSMIEPLGFER